MSKKYTALYVLLCLLVFCVFGYLIYSSASIKKSGDVIVSLYKPSIVPYPKKLELQNTSSNSIAALSPAPKNSVTQAYCDKYGIDYIESPASDVYQYLFHLLRTNKYEYVVLLHPSVIWNPHSEKPLQRLIQQSGDSDLIVSRDDKDPGALNTNFLIFKNTEWSQYKCIELYLHPENIQSILLDQVYTKFKHKSLLKAKDQLDKGLPYLLQCTCVYNEKAFELDHSDRTTYPWTGVPGFVEVPKVVVSLSKNLNQKIPAVMYQTMSSTLLNSDLYKFGAQEWRRMNPEYEYYFFDEKDCRKFIEQNFDVNVVRAYNMLLPGAYKADLFRYCLLYIKGGCYLDSQTQPLLPLRTVVKAESEFVSAIDQSRFALWQGFLCCIPGHPVLKLAIDEAVSHILRRKYFSNPLRLTGPQLLGTCLNRWLRKPAYKSLKRKLPPTITLLRHTLSCQPYVCFGKFKFLLTKYFLNEKQLSEKPDSISSIYQLSGKEHYNLAHRNKRVFKLALLL